MTEDEVKRRIRRLKQAERKIRSFSAAAGGTGGSARDMVWDRFFDLSGAGKGKAAHSLQDLAAMDRVRYRETVDEFFACVYYEWYKENGIGSLQGVYDPALLAEFGLGAAADEGDIKRRFRELAKRFHPDTGGDAPQFAGMMEIYRRLKKG